MKEFNIYYIHCIISNHGYVGITTKSVDLRVLKGHNNKNCGAPILTRAFEKYGYENFLYQRVDTATSIEELGEKERYWIKKMGTLAPNGYNMLEGGFTNTNAAKANREPIFCLETGRRYGSLVEASECTGTPAYLISFNLIGKQDTANNKHFFYIDRLKRIESERKRRKRVFKSTFKNAIINLETGDVYSSSIEASKKTGMPKSTVYNYASGISNPKPGRKLSFLCRRKNLKLEEDAT